MGEVPKVGRVNVQCATGLKRFPLIPGSPDPWQERLNYLFHCLPRNICDQSVVFGQHGSTCHDWGNEEITSITTFYAQWLFTPNSATCFLCLAECCPIVLASSDFNARFTHLPIQPTFPLPRMVSLALPLPHPLYPTPICPVGQCPVGVSASPKSFS